MLRPGSPFLSALGEGTLATLDPRLLDGVQQAVIATDVSGRVLVWNAHASRLYGWSAEEAVGRSIMDLTPSETSLEDAKAIMANLSRGRSWAGEIGVRRKDGSRFTAFVVDAPILDDGGALVGVVGVSTDVSEQRAITAQLRQATERAAELARGLLAESVAGGAPGVTEIGAALARLEPVLRRLVDETVLIEVEPWATPLAVAIDPPQLDQVLVSLAVHARDTMPAGGTLRIRVEPVTGTTARAGADPDGDTVRISVSDTGAGLAPELLARVFEPIFTSKEAGRGGGLGLAAVYAIIRRHGGTIDLESEVGAGTTFRIMLPRAS
ncbi:MAG: PAS domain S-box protein, partial [Gemmatimonadetes bacterium]|nr:PAS domain S-box protein [Gemmatimonadota bacterium]